MNEAKLGRVIPWVLVFLYFPFLYQFGAKLASMSYIDFPSFYLGAHVTFDHHSSPYNFHALRQAGAGEFKTVYPYLYPPPSLLMLAPLAGLSERAAKSTILIANHLSILLILYILLVKILGFELRELVTKPLPALLLVYFMSSRGVQLTIETAQMNLFILLLLCLSWWALKAEGPVWAVAAPLALATLFKIFPALLIGLLIIRRKYKAAAMTGAMILLACGISFMVLPHQLWRDWATNVAPSCGYFKNPMNVLPPTLAGNMGISAFIARFCLPRHLYLGGSNPVAPALWPHPRIGLDITYLLIGGLILSTSAGAYFSRLHRRLNHWVRMSDLDLEYAAFLALMFLTAPLAWEHHLVYVMPAAILCLTRILSVGEENETEWPMGLLLAAACIIAWPLLPGSQHYFGAGIIQTLSAMKLCGALMLWAWLIWQLIGPESLKAIQSLRWLYANRESGGNSFEPGFPASARSAQ